MFSKLTITLKKPYDLFERKKFRWYVVAVPGAFVALFIFMFKPFGFSNTPYRDILPLALLYGSITSVVLFINLFLIQPLIFKKFTIGKTLLWNTWILVSIGLVNAYVVLMVFNNGTMIFSYFIMMQGYTLSLGSIITFFMILIHYNYSLKSTIRKISVDNSAVTLPDITINTGMNHKPVKIKPNDLYYIQSADNYIEIFSRNNSEIVSHLVRMTLKEMEKILTPHAQFKRCHRGYIVNTDYIKCIKSSANGYRLVFSNGLASLPVSRNYKAELETIFQET